jgi:magnesium chelatase family protein
MFIKISSVASTGLDSVEVDVEVNVLQKGMPTFEIVGLPAKAVSESKERVRAAIKNSEINFPQRKIIINLAPADIPKEGSCYDLPIAVGILSVILGFKVPKKTLFFGELSLDGSLRHTKGALLMALFAKENNFKNVFLPADSANEAAVVKGINIYPVNNLSELVDFFFGKENIKKAEHVKKKEAIFQEFDMSEIIGQESAKRALEVAAAGGHNIFMVGGPGSGKTMLSRALPSILPLLNEEESLEVTKIYSASGNIPPGGSLVTTRPFRAPHHTISSVGLIGGGTFPKPGEITLAHRGVLFLDELNEFQRSSLEAMRQPMEDGYVSISRSRERVVYPSKYMLVASANPCPCGYLNHEIKNCLCSEREVEKYKKRVSGPLLDRVDMYIDVPDVETKKLSLSSKEREGMEYSREIRERVKKAREIQKKRFEGEEIFVNSEMKNKHIEKYSFIKKEAENLLISASSKYSFSARSYFKILKLSRTIADIEENEAVETNHVAEALQYKIQEPKL